MTPTEWTGLLGGIVGLLGGLAMLFTSLRRVKYQNLTDQSSSLRTLQETVDMATKARLETEQKLSIIMQEYEARERAMQIEIDDLRALLKVANFEVRILVQNLADPIIKSVEIRRIPVKVRE